jgi:hypothetical protein
MMEELISSETSVLTRATRRNIPGDGKAELLEALFSVRCVSYAQKVCSSFYTELVVSIALNNVAGDALKSAGL